MERTWSLIVVGVEAAGEPSKDGHFDEENDGVQQRLWVEAFSLAIAAARGQLCASATGYGWERRRWGQTGQGATHDSAIDEPAVD